MLLILSPANLVIKIRLPFFKIEVDHMHECYFWLNLRHQNLPLKWYFNWDPHSVPHRRSWYRKYCHLPYCKISSALNTSVCCARVTHSANSLALGNITAQKKSNQGILGSAFRKPDSQAHDVSIPVFSINRPDQHMIAPILLWYSGIRWSFLDYCWW